MAPCHQLVALGGLHLPNHADISSQGMLTTGFVSAGIARTYGTTRSPWAAGNNLMEGGRRGAAPWRGQCHGPHVLMFPRPFVLPVGGCGARTCPALATGIHRQHPLSTTCHPACPLHFFLQGRHGLPGSPGPPGPQGPPGESAEGPGKKGDRVSTSGPSPRHPRTPGHSNLAPWGLSLPLVPLVSTPMLEGKSH